MNNATRKTFFIWLNDKETKRQRISTVEAYKVVENLCVDAFKYGGTIYESHWIYKHDDGELVKEKSLVVIVYTEEDHTEFVKNVKVALNQESVLVEVNRTNIDFA